jgi:hypothetical protein
MGPVNPNSTSGTMVGVTVWRLRSPKPQETGARLMLIEGSGEKRDLLPERLEANTVLSEGDRVRLSVELPANGYLYVVDREQYSDGTASDPYLIYPNQLTRPGDNALAPGRQIEIPDRRNDSSYFTIRRSRPTQSAELLSLVVTPQGQPGLKIGDKPLLVDKLYAEWEKKWGGQTERYEQEGGAGRAWTEKEKDVGGSGGTLTQDDELTQTLYRVDAKIGSPLMVRIALRIKQ